MVAAVGLATLIICAKVRHAHKCLSAELDAAVTKVTRAAQEAGAEIGFTIGYRAGVADASNVIPLRRRRSS